MLIELFSTEHFKNGWKIWNQHLELPLQMPWRNEQYEVIHLCATVVEYVVWFMPAGTASNKPLLAIACKGSEPVMKQRAN